MNSIKTLLRNSLGQENLHDLMLIACDGLATQIISSRPIDKWLVSGNGGLHLNRRKNKIPQCVDEN